MLVSLAARQMRRRGHNRAVEHAAFDALTQRIVDRVKDDDRVLGLVMLGSAGNLERRDEWSDHDFFLITRPGEQETFRSYLWWLADEDEVAGAIRETAHGVQVILNEGHLLEFAVFDPDEIALARINDRYVVLDKADITSRIESLAAFTDSVVHFRPVGESAFLLASHVLIGVARFRRGEVTAARKRLTAIAVPELTSALLQHHKSLPPDPLDLSRRIEKVLPDEAAAIESALARTDLALAGNELLDVAELALGSRPDFPQATFDAVRTRLGYALLPRD
jgi:hypothetical protein